jgi:hypothetical protein
VLNAVRYCFINFVAGHARGCPGCQLRCARPGQDSCSMVSQSLLSCTPYVSTIDLSDGTHRTTLPSPWSVTSTPARRTHTPIFRLPAGVPKVDILESFNSALKRYLGIRPRQASTRLRAGVAFDKLTIFMYGWSVQISESAPVFYWEVDKHSSRRVADKITLLWDSTNEYCLEVRNVAHYRDQSDNGE